MASDAFFDVTAEAGVVTQRGPIGVGVEERKPQLDLNGVEWLSSSQGVGDVQIAFVDGYIAMRDGRSPEGPALIFTPAEWNAFVLGARDGEFDLT
ncbi:protein of unknown function [Streptacidiphilus jiangxiensis]|uniref:DUF397 domain-containing protein n=1 Tax=Streptacidiphilus jiangxiensis TaxID=235985 RepID=A0A1H7UBC2_STRJI|nr:protein of unknown function [Streptacidiphilus jiangxiensis]